MENYICINGNKTELTEEQLKQLGIKLLKANPFEIDESKPFYFIAPNGNAMKTTSSVLRNQMHDVANYCTDKAIVQQRALHETLNRLLWRYSMEHDGDKIDWNDTYQQKYVIEFTHYKSGATFEVEQFSVTHSLGSVYFATESVAFAAIEEIIKPFIAAHPDFKF
jgi:hypothetical protein